MYSKKMRVLYRIKKRNQRGLPILSVRRTAKHLYVDLLDENNKNIIITLSTLNKDVIESLKGEAKTYNKEGAKILGRLCAERMKSNGISEYVFNRGENRYCGNIMTFNEELKINLKGEKHDR